MNTDDINLRCKDIRLNIATMHLNQFLKVMRMQGRALDCVDF